MFLVFHDITYVIKETHNYVVKTFIWLRKIQNGIEVQITEKKPETFRNTIIIIIIIISFSIQILSGVFQCFFRKINFLLLISIQCDLNVQCKFITKYSSFCGLPCKYLETW